MISTIRQQKTKEQNGEWTKWKLMASSTRFGSFIYLTVPKMTKFTYRSVWWLLDNELAMLSSVSHSIIKLLRSHTFSWWLCRCKSFTSSCLRRTNTFVYKMRSAQNNPKRAITRWIFLPFSKNNVVLLEMRSKLCVLIRCFLVSQSECVKWK